MRRIILCLLMIMMTVFISLSATLNGIKPVEATVLSRTEHTDTVFVTGVFENEDKTDIKFSYPIYVKDVYVKENDYVSRGQALLSVDTEKMYSAISGQSYSDMPALSDVSLYMLSDISETIYAPDDGVISAVNAYKGAFIMKNDDIISILGSDTIQARFTVTQSDFGKIGIGNEVKITSVAFPDRSYTGKISDKNAVVKKQASVTGSKVLIDVFADIDNKDRKIADGLQINGLIYTAGPSEKNMLDYRYINQDENGEFVFILSDGRAEKVYVETGTETESSTEILTDFSKDTVFICGEIEDGDKVILTGKADEYL